VANSGVRYREVPTQPTYSIHPGVAHRQATEPGNELGPESGLASRKRLPVRTRILWVWLPLLGAIATGAAITKSSYNLNSAVLSTLRTFSVAHIDPATLGQLHFLAADINSDAGPLNGVKAYGARGDGTSDDTTAISAAQAAAEAMGGGIYFPPSLGSYNVSSGFILKRRTRIVCGPGVTIKLVSVTAKLFTFGSNTDATWSPGGIENCTLSGNGGGSDTSVGVQIGNSTNSAHGVSLVNVDISGFGDGVVISGSGDAFALIFDRLKTHNNACNGIRFDTATTPETSTLANSMVFNNGNASATCTGLLASANSNGDIRINNTHFDNNGNGTLGQIYAPSTGGLTLWLDAAHFEKANGVASTDIALLSSGGPRSSLYVTNSIFTENPSGTSTTKPIVQFAAATVNVSNSAFTYSAGASVTPIFDVGASVGGQSIWFTLRNSILTCQATGTPVNCEALSVTGSPTFLNYDVTGTSLSGFGPATTLFNIPAGAVGCHDFGMLSNNGGPTGSRICSGKMGVGGETLAAAPRAVYAAFFPSALTTTWTGATLTLDKAINVTRFQVQAKTAPAGCATNAVMRISNGTTFQDLTVSAATNDSGAINKNYVAGSLLTIVVRTAAVGCITPPADVMAVAQYRMQ